MPGVQTSAGLLRDTGGKFLGKAAMKFCPEEVLFFPTAECNLSCPHCSNIVSDKILSKTLAASFLSGCKKIGIDKVGFSGGEPFLAEDFVFRLVRKAVEENMAFDRIMTNGVWFTNGVELDRVLRGLKRSGYDGDICVSIDVFHAQDPRKIARFIEAAVRIWNRADIVSIACVIGFKDSATRRLIHKLAGALKADTEGLDTRHPSIRNGSLFVKILQIDLSPVGRASAFKDPWGKSWFKDDYCRGPGNVLAVMPDGSVKPCCGYNQESEYLTIGDIARDTPGIIVRRAHKDPLIRAIFETGLGRLRKRLERRGVRFPGKADDICFFCNYILTDVPRRDLLKCIGKRRA